MDIKSNKSTNKEEDSASNESNLPKSSQPKNVKLKLDYRMLDEKLQEELESDKLYWMQNDAKMRAISEVGSYDEFRQRVLAAHLRPLDKKDKNALNPGAGMYDIVTWNHVAGNNPVRQSDETNSSNNPVSGLSFKIPTRLDEFSNEWKKLGNHLDKKYSYLEFMLQDSLSEKSNACSCPLKKIFANEIPVDIFPSILEVLEKKYASVEQYDVTLKTLGIAADSKTFAFATVFLTSTDRSRLANIFNEIDERKLGDDKILNSTSHLFNSVKAKYINVMKTPLSAHVTQ